MLGCVCVCVCARTHAHKHTRTLGKLKFANMLMLIYWTTLGTQNIQKSRVGQGEDGSNWLIMHSKWADISSLMGSSLQGEKNSVQSQEDITQGNSVCVRVCMLSCASSSDQSLSITWSTCLSPFTEEHGTCHGLYIGHKREIPTTA